MAEVYEGESEYRPLRPERDGNSQMSRKLFIALSILGFALCLVGLPMLSYQVAKNNACRAMDTAIRNQVAHADWREDYRFAGGTFRRHSFFMDRRSFFGELCWSFCFEPDFLGDTVYVDVRLWGTVFAASHEELMQPKLHAQTK